MRLIVAIFCCGKTKFNTITRVKEMHLEGGKKKKEEKQSKAYECVREHRTNVSRVS